MSRQRNARSWLTLPLSLVFVIGLLAMPSHAQEAAAPAPAAAPAAPDPTATPTAPDTTGGTYTGANTTAALTKDKRQGHAGDDHRKTRST